MYHSYGFHEVNLVAVECPEHDGLLIFDDAYVVHVVDPETGERLADGQVGSLVVTEFWKTGSPQFRYNTMDLSYLYPPGQCRCGSWMRRMGRFAGRGDNMVKLRGINIWPEAVGAVALAVPGVESDYFVRVQRVGNRDEMTVSVVSACTGDERVALAAAVEHALRTRFGLKISVEIAVPGALDELTQFHTSPKPIRFRDERKTAR
jgi:phenylacetate-CoA ligase